MKTLLRILKISIVICVLVIVLDSIFAGFQFERMLDPKAWGTYFMYTLVLTLINALYYRFFSKKIGWKNAGIAKVLISSAGSVILTMAGFFFCRMIDETIFNNRTFDSFIENESINYYFLPVLFTIIISLFFHLVYFYKALQDKRVKQQKIIAGAASAQFDALKNQLDPHFLFNSLNVLSALIDENPELAQKFTGSLSKVYRYVLEQKNKELVSLEEELKFAKTYMNLLKVRFEDGLVFNISDNFSNPEAKVVPLSLQLLLENTIKHNRVGSAEPLQIDIYEENGCLVVRNKLQHKETLKHSSGVGLQNIKQRYSLLTERKVEIEKTSDDFIVKLPLLTRLTETILPEEREMENNKYVQAKERVKKEKEFYGNLTSYLVVIPFLAIFNYLTTSFPWVIFPALGWGLGLALHAMSAFEYNPFFGKKWEEKKIKEFMNNTNENYEN